MAAGQTPETTQPAPDALANLARPGQPRRSPGAFEDLLAHESMEIQAIAYRLRDIVREVLPEAQENVFDNIVLYQERENICGIEPGQDGCRFHLAHGDMMFDPDGLLEGTGESLRHVTVRAVGDVRPDSLRSLIRQGKNRF